MVCFCSFFPFPVCFLFFLQYFWIFSVIAIIFLIYYAAIIIFYIAIVVFYFSVSHYIIVFFFRFN